MVFYSIFKRDKRNDERLTRRKNMEKKKNDNLYKFSVETPVKFALLALVYAIGAAGAPRELFCYIFGKSLALSSLSTFLVKILCAIVPVWLIFEIKAEKILRPKISLKEILLTLPFLIVALNNFPFLPLFSGSAELLTNEFIDFFCYFLACFGISVFEESVFRGVIFSALYRKFCVEKSASGALAGDRLKNEQNDVFVPENNEKRAEKYKYGEFWAVALSSVLFGAVHLVNLIAGAGIVPVIAQMGYSFLIGAMCAIAMLETGNIYSAVILHAVFDFGGLLTDYGFLSGTIWTVENVILTAVVGVIVAVYAICLLFLPRKNKRKSLLEN